MKLLMTADAVGGVWTYALDLARGLAAHDVETLLAVLGPAPSPDQARAAEAVPGMQLIETGLAPEWLAEDAAEVGEAGVALAKLARGAGVDLIQINHPALGAHDCFDFPVVAVAHSCVGTWFAAVAGSLPDADNSWRADLAAAGLRAADRVVAPTAAFAAATRTVCALARLPEVVHNGRAPLPATASAQGDFAFTAGRLWDKGKNAALLDRAAAKLPAPLRAAGPVQGPNGDCIAFASLETLGLISDRALAAQLAARPIFMSAALYEPFGLAVLEAAQAGCALVLSDIPTFRELWQGAALFVPATDADGFAAAATSLLADPERRAELGRAAQTAAAAYTVEKMAAGMAAIYADLISASGPAAALEAAA